jgi:hypothetical protein
VNGEGDQTGDETNQMTKPPRETGREEPFPLSRKWNREKNPTHHVSLLEIPLWTSGVHIVTIGAPLGQSLIGIKGFEDAGLAIGRDTHIRTIGIHEDLLKGGPLEFRGRAVLFINRPIADQPELNPMFFFSHEAPCFE